MQDVCEYKMYFMNEIKRIGEVVIALQKSILEVALTVEQLKTSDKFRSTIWGALSGGLMAVFVGVIIKLIWSVAVE